MSPGVKNRLGELAQGQTTNKNETIEVEPNSEIPPQFKEVFEKVYEIRNWITNIKENTKNIKDFIHEDNNFINKQAYIKIEERVKNTYNIAFKITNSLKELDVKPTKKDDESDKSILSRMKRIQYGSLRQDFQNALFESNDILEKYREQKRALLKKQAALVNSALNEEELDKLLDNPDGVNLFTDNILLDTRIAKDQLSQIEERHAELLKIEDMLTEINGQFKQIAILVEQQKDHINRIEYHACDAINYVDRGVVDLQKAQRNRRKAKKMMYITIICVVITILIILFIFL